MRTIYLAIGLACAVSSAASAQLAPLDGRSAPTTLDGVAVIGVPGAAVPRDAALASPRGCAEQARAFRARNTQSPSRRQQALADCVAAAMRRERVEIAGD